MLLCDRNFYYITLSSSWTNLPAFEIILRTCLPIYVIYSQVIKDLNRTLLLENPVVRFERKTSLCFEANGEHNKKDIFKI